MNPIESRPGFLTTPRTRRDVLRTTGALAFGAAFGGSLAACASEEDAGPGGPAAPPTGAPAETFERADDASSPAT